MTSIQSSNEENGRSSQCLLVSECISVFRVIRCLKVGTYLSNKGITYLLTCMAAAFIGNINGEDTIQQPWQECLPKAMRKCTT